jgi:putative ABC transport system permease protein
VERFVQDIKHAIRVNYRRPGFAVVAVATLALVIGGTSALFSVTNAVILKPLPYKDPDTLVMIWNANAKNNQNRMRARLADIKEWRRDTHSFEDIAAFVQWRPAITDSTNPEQIGALKVSEGYFNVMKATPLLGRLFVDDDQIEGKPPCVILSYGLWDRKFDRDQAIIGKGIMLDAQIYTIVGVLPRDVQAQPSDAPAELYAPLAMSKDEEKFPFFVPIGRLRHGVSLSSAQADINVVAKRQEEDQPQTHTGLTVRLVGFHADLIGGVRYTLLILQAAVLVVLLMACITVANMLLSRTAERQAEMSVRLALGASRKRLIRQVLTENIVLSLIGGTSGILLCFVGVRVLQYVGKKVLPDLTPISIDWRVLLFTISVSALTGLIFGLVPALQLSKPNLTLAANQAGRGSRGTAGQTMLKNTLVVTQIGFAIAFLIDASLLTLTFVKVNNTYPGFDAHNVITMEIALPLQKYPEYGPERQNFYNQVLDRAAKIPGIRTIGFVSVLPESPNFNRMAMRIRGREYGPGEMPILDEYMVSPGYFRALSIPVMRGRVFEAFDEVDDADHPPTALINEIAAKRLFPEQDPLGAEIRTPQGWAKIVGIVSDLYQYGLDSDKTMQIYIPMRHLPNTPMTLVARTTNDPSSYVAALRSVVLSVDSSQPTYRVATMEQWLSDSIAPRRFTMVLLQVLAGLAFVLATIGIYGLISYNVVQRTQEFGIRMALGAHRATLVGMVLREGLILTAVGVALGLIATWIMTPLVASLLYGVSPKDIATFIWVPAVLLFVALLACCIPAWRTTRIDLVNSLRHE